MNIFERASRAALRFPSVKGELTTEDLWNLPLVASTRATRDVKVDLDTVARTVNSNLKNVTEESFVNLKPDPRKTTFELQLEIVKHIIESKMSDQAAAESRAAKAEQRRILIEALSTKQNEKVGAMSEEEIKAKLAELDS